MLYGRGFLSKSSHVFDKVSHTQEREMRAHVAIAISIRKTFSIECGQAIDCFVLKARFTEFNFLIDHEMKKICIFVRL